MQTYCVNEFISKENLFLNIMETETPVSIRQHIRKLSFNEVMIIFMHSFYMVPILQCRIFKFWCQGKIPFWKLWKLSSFSPEKNIWNVHTSKQFIWFAFPTTQWFCLNIKKQYSLWNGDKACHKNNIVLISSLSY